jgi:hypothetical protein
MKNLQKYIRHFPQNFGHTVVERSISKHKFPFKLPICVQACGSMSSQELPVPSTITTATKINIPKETIMPEIRV